MNKTEIIEIGNDNFKSSNFGGGVELLMNNDKKNKNRNTSIEFDDLNNLEKELNDLSFVDDEKIEISSEPQFFDSDLFNGNENNENNDNKKISFDDINTEKKDIPSIGQSTAYVEDDKPSWDGYQNFNDIPLNTDKRNNYSVPPQMTKEELLREKFKFLRKLEALEKKDITLSKKYNMDSSLAEMQGEYETIMDEKNKLNSIKFQANMMLAFINGIEFLNNKFDPFDIKLDGLSDQITENLNDYDEVFGELYEKYKSKTSMAPELKLLFQIGGSAMMVHMTNTMFKSSMPNMDDILKQNPDLMRSFQQAAVNSMSSNAPGLSSFMDGILNDNNIQGPPPPMSTQYRQPQPEIQENYSNRGGNNSYGQFNYNNFKDDGININENKSYNQKQNISKEQSKRIRSEMKGPSDINELLGKLKTKTINIQEQNTEYNPNISNDDNNIQDQDYTNNNSTISINDLKELNGNIKLPKKSNRKKGSEKNLSSIDISF